MLDVEDGLVLLFHLPCQPREPVRGLFRRVTHLRLSMPEHPLNVALEEVPMPLREGGSS